MENQNPSSTIDNRPYCPIRSFCPVCTETDYKSCLKYKEKQIYFTTGACGLSCEDFYEENSLEDIAKKEEK